MYTTSPMTLLLLCEGQGSDRHRDVITNMAALGAARSVVRSCSWVKNVHRNNITLTKYSFRAVCSGTHDTGTFATELISQLCCC